MHFWVFFFVCLFLIWMNSISHLLMGLLVLWLWFQIITYVLKTLLKTSPVLTMKCSSIFVAISEYCFFICQTVYKTNWHSNSSPVFCSCLMINYFTAPAVASRTSVLKHSSSTRVNVSARAKMPFHFQAKPAGFGQKVLFCLRRQTLSPSRPFSLAVTLLQRWWWLIEWEAVFKMCPC